MQCAPYLFVDLDGTFTKADIAGRLLVKRILHNPFLFFRYLYLYIVQGPLKLKEVLAAEEALHIQSLPVNPHVLHLIDQYKKSGSKIILATATHHALAQKVLECFPHFDGCLASTDYLILELFQKAGQNLNLARRVVSPMSLQTVSDRGQIPMSAEIQNLKQEEYSSGLINNRFLHGN